MLIALECVKSIAGCYCGTART